MEGMGNVPKEASSYFLIGIDKNVKSEGISVEIAAQQ